MNFWNSIWKLQEHSVEIYEKTLSKNISSNQIVKTLFSRYFFQKAVAAPWQNYFHGFFFFQEIFREINVVIIIMHACAMEQCKLFSRNFSNKTIRIFPQNHSCAKIIGFYFHDFFYTRPLRGKSCRLIWRKIGKWFFSFLFTIIQRQINSIQVFFKLETTIWRKKLCRTITNF